MECGARLRYVWRRAGRQKEVGEADTHTSLRRCLSMLQMTALGLGSTVGVGIYVLLGVAIRDYAGPGVVLSFLGAGGVVLINALIFAEFGSYIPHTGGSYTYMYKAVGELAAFLTGWMGVFSLTCSAATGARAWSGFVDSLFNNSIQTFMDQHVGQLDLGPPFARSLDWLAFAFFLALTGVVACHVQCSSMVNTVLAVLTTGVLVFVAVAGFVVGDVRRLADPDTGGFLPYGWDGVIAGASAAFFAFNGYDTICISAEEAKDPVKSVPRAILLELVIVTVVYCGAALGVSCLVPYTLIDLRAPIPSAFAFQGLTWARYVVTVGPALAMTNLSLMSLYAQSRIFYRMAQDGLLLRHFARVHPTTKVPLLGVGVCGGMVSLMALFLELKDLVRFSVLCMLFQYIVLAPALINLRASEGGGEGGGESLKPGARSLADPDYERVKPDSDGESGRADSLLMRDRGGEGSNLGSAGSSVNEEESESVVDDGSPGLTHSRVAPASGTYSYVADGDLGFGSHADSHQSDADFPPTSPADGVSLNHRHPPPPPSPHGDTVLVDVTPDPGGRLSPNDVSRPLLPALRNRTADPNSASPAHHEPRSSEDARRQARSDSPARQPGPETGGGGGWFERTMDVVWGLLTTPRCLCLLVLVLATLAMQLGLAWADLRALKPPALLAVALSGTLLVLLCNILRKRCGPGKHKGFKCFGVPYIPALSCFLNMLLLVSAADYLGILEFTVLLATGLVVYVAMVMSQWSRDKGVTAARAVECRSLLTHQDSDADSEGSL